MSARDTRLIGLWRVIVVLSLIATATAITISTYRILEEEQNDNFVTAVSMIDLELFRLPRYGCSPIALYPQLTTHALSLSRAQLQFQQFARTIQDSAVRQGAPLLVDDLSLFHRAPV